MLLYRLLEACVLLAFPQHVEAIDSVPLHAQMAPPLRRLAIALEIFDPREGGHILAKPEHFMDDLKVLHGRYYDLVAAPALVECQRFPGRDVVEDFLAFNRSFKKDLETRLPLDPAHAEDLRVALDENERLFQIWDAVREAACQSYYITVRRQALMRLRTLLGPEAFYAGNLPPNVPTWRIPAN